MKSKSQKLIFFIVVIQLVNILFFYKVSNAQTIEIGNKFVCDLSDPSNPLIFRVRNGQQEVIDFDTAIKIANRALKKAKTRLRKAKRSGASSKKIKKLKKKKKNAAKNKREVLECQDSTLTEEFPPSGMSMVSVVSSTNSNITGTCTFSYEEHPTTTGNLRAIADKTRVDITCDMSTTSSLAAFGEIFAKTKQGDSIESHQFISGISLSGTGFSVTLCEFNIEQLCDKSKTFAESIADPNKRVSIEFTYAGNEFTGVFPEV